MFINYTNVILITQRLPPFTCLFTYKSLLPFTQCNLKRIGKIIVEILFSVYK